jgi:hypothetical protein
LNELAPRNISPKETTLDVFQPPIDEVIGCNPSLVELPLLKLEALRNIPTIVVTELVFQVEMSWLNDDASRNAYCKLVIPLGSCVGT